MASTRTIEEYVAEIMKYLHAADFDELSDTVKTLERMKFTGKVRYKLNYWRVMQCLGEMTSDMQVKYLVKFDKVSCKCHYHQKLRCYMRLFVEMMCNVAVVKRILTFKTKLMLVLFKSIRQTEEEYLTVLSLQATLRCLIVGKAELTELFMKYGLLKDIYREVKKKNDTNHFSYGAFNLVLICFRLVRTISVCGTENIRKQLRRSHILRVMGVYIGKLEANRPDKIGVEDLTELFADIKAVLGEEKEAERFYRNWKPKEELMTELDQEQIHTFCSSPSCRKLYEEGLKLRYCGACRVARYCSEECQREHWKNGHKDTCQHSPEIKDGKKIVDIISV